MPAQRALTPNWHRPPCRSCCKRSRTAALGCTRSPRAAAGSGARAAAAVRLQAVPLSGCSAALPDWLALPPETPVHFFCRSGNCSAQAARALRRVGHAQAMRRPEARAVAWRGGRGKCAPLRQRAAPFWCRERTANGAANGGSRFLCQLARRDCRQCRHRPFFLVSNGATPPDRPRAAPPPVRASSGRLHGRPGCHRRRRSPACAPPGSCRGRARSCGAGCPPTCSARSPLDPINGRPASRAGGVPHPRSVAAADARLGRAKGGHVAAAQADAAAGSPVEPRGGAAHSGRLPS